MRLFLATANRHKVEEFRALEALYPIGAEVLPASALGPRPPVEEDACTFAANAAIKCRALRQAAPADAWVLADDSGLCVDALGGGPGVFSARYAGEGAGDRANLEKLLRVLAPAADEDRGARFVCVLCLQGPDGVERYFEGQCRGRITRAPAGCGGFGYDPIFVPEGESLTYAELGDAVKHRLSHRALAWQALGRWRRG